MVILHLRFLTPKTNGNSPKLIRPVDNDECSVEKISSGKKKNVAFVAKIWIIVCTDEYKKKYCFFFL